MQRLLITTLCYSILLLGLTPELMAMPVDSAVGASEADTKTAREVSTRLAQVSTNLSPEEIGMLLTMYELQCYSLPGAVCGGGYYGTSQPSNQYSSFFSNIENFLVELVEFFLFLAMLSYVVGYEEWLPWEKAKAD